MRPLGTVATAMLLAASAVGFVGPASTARADTKEDVAINGTYRVTSIGNWAKINDQYNGEPTTVQTWTLSSTCTSFQECDGTVKSDEGWSARLYMLDGTSWFARREVPNWERCEDGTARTHDDVEEIMRRVPDITKARTRIGFAPSRTLDDVLRDVIAERTASEALAA